MTITLSSRKTVRQKLALLLAEITTFVAVYDHETKDFGQRSPVGMVHSDGTQTEFPGYAREHHRVWVTVLWRRDSADATEDYIDDLGQAVRQKLLDNHAVAGYWDDLRIDEEFSRLDYPMIDNVMYRRERIPVVVEVTSAS